MTRIRASVLACLLAPVSLGCGSSSKETSPPESHESVTAPSRRDEAAGLAEAQRWLAGEIKSGEIEVAFDKPALALAPPCVIDIEYGSGHGGSLAFVRLTVGAATTRCERVGWLAYNKDPAVSPGEAVRAETPTATLEPLLDSIRALSTATVTEHPNGRYWHSSGDFFALVRVVGKDAASDRTWEFAGYPGTGSVAVYAAPKAVVGRARAILDPLDWKPVEADDLRRTHFPDAFVRNRDLCAEKGHWWVMERSIEAQGWFGDRSAIPVAAWILDHAPGIIERQVVKIRTVLDQPGRYLEGPPQNLPEK